MSSHECQAVVEMRGIVKRFPGVVANDHVDLKICRGEVLAILGENGAGKTTLMNVLYGLYLPDEGEIYVKGRRVSHRSPRDAIENGIGMVHQHFTLVDDLTVAENVVLGAEKFRVFYDLEKLAREIDEFMRTIGLYVDPLKKAHELSAGEKQKVEILKALYRKVEVLILDEPTSVLSPIEVRELFKTMRNLKSTGISVVFISHKLDEVMEIADRIVVMRGGKVVGELARHEATKQLLATLMIGSRAANIEEKFEKRVRPAGKLLEVVDLWVKGDRGEDSLKAVNLVVRKGEIVGIAGVAGSGQRELAEAIYGLRPAWRGRILLEGKDITRAHTVERIKMGVSLIPEDRLRYGVAAELPVYENVYLEKVHLEGRKSLLDRVGLRVLDKRGMVDYAKKVVEKFGVKTPSVFTNAGKLSGGNIQRLIVGRELERKPLLVIADEPTAGLDIAATNFVRKTIVEMSEAGAGVLLISSDLQEVLELSDKVVILCNGEVMGVFRPGELSMEEIGLLMSCAKRMSKEEVERAWGT
ncbi:ABC transporter ATP-binding protein [Thermogladius sp.]|uniref:ABC transporter ATP-binding protein n=1 Tax=Thermogladius sp. TaxID=2023064 RepID=UPI003D0E734F